MRYSVEPFGGNQLNRLEICAIQKRAGRNFVYLHVIGQKFGITYLSVYDVLDRWIKQMIH